MRTFSRHFSVLSGLVMILIFVCLAAVHAPRAAMYGPYKDTQPSAPSYPPPSTDTSASLYPEMNPYGLPPKAQGDAAAQALSGLQIDKERELEYNSTARSGNYPPSTNASGPYPSQGLPYLASPIGGVVTGLPYTPPTSAYNSYPPPAAHALNLPENLDVSSAGREHTKESSYPPQYYPGSSSPHPEGYPPAPSSYPPGPNVSSTGDQVYPAFSPYGALAPSTGVPHDAAGHDRQGNQKTKKDFDSVSSIHDSSPAFPGAYPPHLNAGYPPHSGPHEPSPPVGYPSQQTVEKPPVTAYPVQQNVNHGEQIGDSGLTSQSQTSSEGSSTAEKGFDLNKLKQGLGYLQSATQSGQSQQGYPQSGQSQHGYPQSGHSQPGYSQQGYPQPGYPQSGHSQPGYPQSGHSQPGYPQSGHSQHGYPPPGYPQSGHSQPGYPQPGYPQHGYPQAGYAQPSYAPNYPPAYPGHGYSPEAYPSQHGYGASGHSGHSGGHSPTPYAATHGHSVAQGAPYYGHGEYKQHKGGHKGHKKQKKFKGHQGSHHQYEQPYGYLGGYSGGHQGGHGKHGHKKHKH